jgi:K+ transporter
LIIRAFFEKHYSLRVVLLLFVLMGTSMVIGDGVLTPTMSGDDQNLLISCMYRIVLV